MTENMSVDVMTALARVAYSDETDCLDYLHSLGSERLERTAFGVAVMANAFLTALAVTTGEDVDEVRTTWLAALTDIANTPP